MPVEKSEAHLTAMEVAAYVDNGLVATAREAILPNAMNAAAR